MRNYLAPWLTIWFRPVETIDRLLNTKHCKFILFFIFSIYYMEHYIPFFSLKSVGFLYLTYAIFVLLATLFLFLISKLFKGKASYRELLVVMILSWIPNIISKILNHADIIGSSLSFYISMWGTMLFIVMFSYVEKISIKKIFFIFTLIMVALGLIYIFSIKEQVGEPFHFYSADTSCRIPMGIIRT